MDTVMTLPYRLNALLLGFACLALAGCSTPATSTRVEQLLKTGQSWDGTPYASYPAGAPEFTVLKISIPANTALNWHTHPMPNVAYLMSGELSIETRDGKHTTTLKPGQALPEVVNTSHRGISGNAPVELIVFYAGSPGLKLSE